MGPLIEVLDRDGQVRQSFPVAQWPLRVGRALDNDVVLSDPHVAAHHFTIDEHDAGAGPTLTLTVGETRNGVMLGHTSLASGAHTALATSGDAIELVAGRTRVRVRLPGHALAPELVIAPQVSLPRRIVPLIAAAAVVIAGLLFTTYLASDPDGLTRAIGNALLSAVVGGALWCGAWALLSKLFTRQAHFGWHVRVFLFSGIALLVISNLPALLAFAFSAPAFTDFEFVGEIVLFATALYFHLLAVEPARHRLLKWVAGVCAAVAIGLTMWFNVQRGDSLGDELYMSHLFPPAWRVAKPITTDAFIDGLAPLKATLDRKAKEPGRGDEGRGEED